MTKSTIVRDITPCSPLKVNRRFGGTYRLHLQGRKLSQPRNQLCLPHDFTLFSCSFYSSALKMEAMCSSETSVGFQQTTRRYIPEDNILHNHRCENLKSYVRNDVLDVHLTELDPYLRFWGEKYFMVSYLLATVYRLKCLEKMFFRLSLSNNLLWCCKAIDFVYPFSNVTLHSLPLR
jgi:hypothetical protein